MPTLDIAACHELMEGLTAISLSAAAAIVRCGGNPGIRSKADGSPVTTADEAAEAVIIDGLARVVPQLPVISEERPHRAVPVGRGSFILVDPLDGTREFIAGRDEYTINVALVTDGTPMLGIIAAPALGLLWRGIAGRGAERLDFSGENRIKGPARPIHVRTRPQGPLTVVVSRSHLEARTRGYIDRLPGAELVPCGSSLKFCRIAEGSADLYPRLAPTHDWDVAAGHAIVAAAGGKVAAPDGTPLIYGTKDLLVPAFIAAGDPSAVR